jgi:hypothetical protein
MELRRGLGLVVAAFLLFGVTVGIYEFHEAASAHSANKVSVHQQVEPMISK